MPIKLYLEQLKSYQISNPFYFSALYHNSNNGSGIFGRDASFNSGNSRASSEIGDEERDMHSDISLEEDVNDLNQRVSKFLLS